MEEGLLLKWNNHKQAFFSVLTTCRIKESYCDVTLACDGKFYPVHKLVLSSCSEYFEEIFERTDCKHPIVVLKDINYYDLETLLNYMYIGEIHVSQDKLSSLISAAECLRVKGLAANDEPADQSSSTSAEKHSAPNSSPYAKRRKVDTNKNSSYKTEYSVKKESSTKKNFDSLENVSENLGKEKKLVKDNTFVKKDNKLNCNEVKATKEDSSTYKDEEVTIKHESDVLLESEDPLKDESDLKYSMHLEYSNGSDLPDASNSEADNPLISEDAEELTVEAEYGNFNSGFAQSQSSDSGDVPSYPFVLGGHDSSLPSTSTGMQMDSESSFDDQNLSGTQEGTRLGSLQFRKEGSRSYVCEVCEKHFKFKTDVKRHILSHTGEKPFSCKYCQYKGNRKSHLKRHIVVMHGLEFWDDSF